MEQEMGTSQRHNRRSGSFMVLALVTLLCLTASACRIVTIRTLGLTIGDSQDSHEFSGGTADEPLVGVISWRTTIGKPGSSIAQVLTSVDDLGSFNEGTTFALPPFRGEKKFLVNELTLAGLNAGGVPDIVGTTAVLIENDLPYPSSHPGINALMEDLAEEIEDRLESRIAALTPNNATSPALALQMDAAIADVLYPDDLPTLDEFVYDNLPIIGDGPVNPDLAGVHNTALLTVDSQLTPAFSGFGDSAEDDDEIRPMLETPSNFLVTDEFFSDTDGVWHLTTETNAG